MAGSADHLVAHGLDRGKHVLDPGPHAGNARVACFLSLGQWLVGLGLALDLRPVAFGLQRLFPLLARIAPVGIDVAAGVAGIEQRLEVLAVVGAGRVGLQTPDESESRGEGFSRCPLDEHRFEHQIYSNAILDRLYVKQIYLIDLFLVNDDGQLGWILKAHFTDSKRPKHNLQ